MDDPADAIQTWDRITTRKQLTLKEQSRPFNPAAREDYQLFQVLLNGQHCGACGFSNPDIREQASGILSISQTLPDVQTPKRESQPSSPSMLHAHGLIAKVPRSRRWRVTRLGRVAMAASMQFREIQFPAAYMKLAS